MELAFDVDPVPCLVVLAASLTAGLLGMRALRAAGLSHARAAWSKPIGPLWMWLLLAGLTLLASAPLVAGAWGLCGSGSMLPGDAASHAQVAREIAEHGLARGWIESYSAGFPFGPHYQSGALLVIAGLVRLGAPALGATIAVGIASVLLVPLLFLLAARAAGAAPYAALAGALLLSWAVPAHTFIGGPWPMLSQGLISQVFAMPWIMLTAAAVLGALPRWLAPLLAAAAMASHAQLTPCALLAAAPTVVIAGSQSQRRSLLSAALGAGVSGLALYGPGLRSFALPFSWAPVPAFRIVGYGPNRLLGWWLSGKLLDVGRAPVLTAVVWAAVVLLLFTARARASRGALLLLGTTLAVGFGGQIVGEMGGAGRRLIEVFSPVRMLCFVPLACAICVCVAASELSARLHRALEPSAAGWLSRWRPVELALLLLLATGAGRPGMSRMSVRVTALEAFRTDACRSRRFGGYRAPVIARRLRALGRGRFVVDKPSPLTPCPVLGGIELASSVPLGAGTAGPGSQVGVMVAAFNALHPSAPGGAKRAEALGVRTIMHTSDRVPAPAARWRRVVQRGQTVLSERIGGTDLMGIGCISAIWRGPDRLLRDALFADLERADPATLDPTALVLLDPTAGALRKRAVARGRCDPARAVITASRTGPGEHRALVETPTGVELVLRATHLASWSVLVDGTGASTRLVAPGFSAVHLDPGRHAILATVAPLPWYRLGLVLGLLGVSLLGWLEWRSASGGRPQPPRPTASGQGPTGRDKTRHATPSA